MLFNHEQGGAWPGTLSFSHCLSFSDSDSLSHSHTSRGFTPLSVKSPKRCQLILLLSWLQTELKPTIEKNRRSPPKQQPKRKSTLTGFSACHKKPRKHSSKLIVVLNMFPSLCLAFFLCFLFGAELSPPWTAWSNDRLGDCFGERESEQVREIVREKERESKGRGGKGGVCSSSCWLFQDKVPTPLIFSLPVLCFSPLSHPSSQLFSLLPPVSSLVCYPTSCPLSSFLHGLESHFVCMGNTYRGS